MNANEKVKSLAIEKLRHAVELDKEGQLKEALEEYKIGLQNMLTWLKCIFNIKD